MNYTNAPWSHFLCIMKQWDKHSLVYPEFWVLDFVLRLVELKIQGSAGDSVRPVGHEQHCELELGYKLSWEQKESGAVNKWRLITEEVWLTNTRLLSPAGRWRAVTVRVWHTPPHLDGLWLHPQMPWWRRVECKPLLFLIRCKIWGYKNWSCHNHIDHLTEAPR